MVYATWRCTCERHSRSIPQNAACPRCERTVHEVRREVSGLEHRYKVDNSGRVWAYEWYDGVDGRGEPTRHILTSAHLARVPAPERLCEMGLWPTFSWDSDDEGDAQRRGA